MASALLAGEAVAAFVLAAGLLFNYGDWRRQNGVVTAAVLLAWFFSLLIVFVLPLDVSSVKTISVSYQTCIINLIICRRCFGSAWKRR